MAKKLLLLLCIVQIRLIQPEVFSPKAKDCFYHQSISSPTLATIDLLEKEKAALISRIKENDTTLERLRFTSNASHHSFYYGCHNSTLSELFLGALIVATIITALKSPDMKKIHALEEEQIKNKDKVAQLEASLETAYFEQLNPEWKKKFLKSKIEAYGLESAKITNEITINDLIIDPGFGFAKNLVQNYEVLKKLELFQILELPILVGVSRKSMIYKLLETNANEALNGTTALNTIALTKGANILRVHDVKEAMECTALYNEVNS